jgi:hypothetical protein
MTEKNQSIERYGEIIFIIVMFLTMPVWMPVLVAWVVIDPFYRMSLWKQRWRDRFENLN